MTIAVNCHGDVIRKFSNCISLHFCWPIITFCDLEVAKKPYIMYVNSEISTICIYNLCVYIIIRTKLQMDVLLHPYFCITSYKNVILWNSDEKYRIIMFSWYCLALLLTCVSLLTDLIPIYFAFKLADTWPIPILCHRGIIYIKPPIFTAVYNQPSHWITTISYHWKPY